MKKLTTLVTYSMIGAACVTAPTMPGKDVISTPRSLIQYVRDNGVKLHDNFSDGSGFCDIYNLELDLQDGSQANLRVKDCGGPRFVGHPERDFLWIESGNDYIALAKRDGESHRMIHAGFDQFGKYDSRKDDTHKSSFRSLVTQLLNRAYTAIRSRDEQ